MSDFLVLVVHFVVTVFRLAKPGGPRSVLAESVLVRHQLLILNRGRKRAPNLCRRPLHRWRMHAFHSPGTTPPLCHRSEAFHPAASAPSANQAKVSLAVFAQARAPSRPKGTGQRAGRCCPGDETTESGLGMPQNRAADRTGFRRRDRQRCSSPYSERSFTGRTGIPEVHPGSPFSATPKTACGAATCSDASPLS